MTILAYFKKVLVKACTEQFLKAHIVECLFHF
ncbi:hypothetical protein MXB_3658 [Myxobolus squamalis]|nr:hypothetical protein MXB_3658 [Myxobolus squamalis]